MAVYLREDEVGRDPATIGYPHLVLCMGVTVVMDDGALIGAHITDVNTEAIVLARVFWEVGQHAGNMLQLYVCGNLLVHHNNGGGDINAKANAIGFHGPGYQFDTAFLNPRDGTFVELTSQGAGNRCIIRYKRDEKVEYTSGAGAGGSRYSDIRNTWVPRAAASVSAVGASKGRFGGSHTINTAEYATRVTPVQIP